MNKTTLRAGAFAAGLLGTAAVANAQSPSPGHNFPPQPGEVSIETVCTFFQCIYDHVGKLVGLPMADDRDNDLPETDIVLGTVIRDNGFHGLWYRLKFLYAPNLSPPASGLIRNATFFYPNHNCTGQAFMRSRGQFPLAGEYDGSGVWAAKLTDDAGHYLGPSNITYASWQAPAVNGGACIDVSGYRRGNTTFTVQGGPAVQMEFNVIFEAPYGRFKNGNQ